MIGFVGRFLRLHFGPRVLGIALSVVACASLALWVSAWLFLISQEDFTPKRGTLTYYLGISSLVRGAPAVGVATEPEYFGTVGDGNKQPRSEVSFEVSRNDMGRAVVAVNAYLLQNGLQERALEPSELEAVQAHNGYFVRYAEYASVADGVVAVTVQPVRPGVLYSVTVSHYE